ncbi:hypothetical protein C0J52_17803 [Blattella germanica]|nr:hypothetical protein C0J52_17803 [Blattella germanica]
MYASTTVSFVVLTKFSYSLLEKVLHFRGINNDSPTSACSKMSCRILSTILVKFISTKCSTKQMNVSLQTTKS